MIRSPVNSIVRGVVITGFGGMRSFDRIQTFGVGTWVDPDTGWQIIIGYAVTLQTDKPLYQEMSTPVLDGDQYELSFNVENAGTSVTLQIDLYQDDALVQTIYDATLTVGNKSVTGTVSGAANRVVLTVTAMGAGPISLQNMSFIA